MVNRIDRLYGNPAAKPPERDSLPAGREGESSPPAREETRVRRDNIAERIAPHLHDSVELSDRAREASRAEQAQGSEAARDLRPEARIIGESWYSAGIAAAYRALDL